MMLFFAILANASFYVHDLFPASAMNWWGWIFVVMGVWSWLFHILDLHDMQEDRFHERLIKRRRLQCYADVFGAVLITVLHILIL